LTDGSDLSYSVVRSFDIAEWERVEQNSPQHEDVGEPWVVGDQEMESTNFVGVTIHKVHRTA
jgi:hypothetical protein